MSILKNICRLSQLSAKVLHYKYTVSFNSGRSLKVISSRSSNFHSLATVSLGKTSVRAFSTDRVIGNVDEFLQFSTTNPLYQGCEYTLTTLHDLTGMPWWATLVLTSFCLRTVFYIPLFISAQKANAKLKLLKPEFEREEKEISRAVKHAKWAHKLSDEETKKCLRLSLKKMKTRLYMQHAVHPFRSFVISVLPAPLWVVMSLTIRTMTTPPHIPTGFLTEGGSWFIDLSLRDPYLVLPLMYGTVALAQFYFVKKVYPSTTLDKRTMRVEGKSQVSMIFLSFGMVCVTSIMPSAISLYWLSSYMFGFLQYALFTVPKVRRLVGIPTTNNEPDVRRLNRNFR